MAKRKRLLELQIDELGDELGISADEQEFIEKAKEKTEAEKKQDADNAKIAELYEDIAEYKESLELFETEVEIVKTTDIDKLAEVLSENNPDYDGDYANEIKEIINKAAGSGDDEKTILVKRWELLISMIKEHIKEEESDLKTKGLKPDYVKRVYEKVHGLR